MASHVFRTWRLLPCRIVTVIYPVENPAAPPPRISSLMTGSAHDEPELAGLLFEDQQEVILVEEQSIRLKHT